MSKLFPHFTKDKPCPACGKWDWSCRAGDRAFICMRVQSNMASRDGGWFHFYNDNIPKPELKQWRPPTRKLIDCSALINSWWDKSDENASLLSKELGVSEKSLLDLGCVWSVEYKSWAFPMYDDIGIIGIQLRGESKKCVTGSRLGLFVPKSEPQKTAYLPEGASDTAALLDIGLYAIGRPTCNAGGELLKTVLKRLGINRVVIVADNDEIKHRPDGKGFRPGQDGAKKLKKELGLMSAIYTPPAPLKDVRQLLNRVGASCAKAMINDSVSMKIWTKI